MLDWFANRWNDFLDFMWALVISVYDMLKDFFFFIIESLLDIALLMLNGMGSLMSGLDITQYIALIPAETAFIMNEVGFSQALGMIVTCLTIRFTLQLIPFVRWGS